MKVYVNILINRDDLQFILNFIKMLRNARENNISCFKFYMEKCIAQKDKGNL